MSRGNKGDSLPILDLDGLAIAGSQLGSDPSFLENLPQRLARVLDMLTQQLAGGRYVPLTTEIQDLMMLFVRPLHTVR